MITKINIILCLICLAIMYVSGEALAMSEAPDTPEKAIATTDTAAPTDSSNASDKPKVVEEKKPEAIDEQSVTGAKDRADTTGGIDVGDRQPATNSRGDPMNTKASGQ
jgi:hypothetical protein